VEGIQRLLPRLKGQGRPGLPVRFSLATGSRIHHGPPYWTSSSGARHPLAPSGWLAGWRWVRLLHVCVTEILVGCQTLDEPFERRHLPLLGIRVWMPLTDELRLVARGHERM